MALPFCEPAKTTGGKGGKGGNLTMRPCRPEDLFVPQHMTREVNEMRAAGTLSKARSGQQKTTAALPEIPEIPPQRGEIGRDLPRHLDTRGQLRRT